MVKISVAQHIRERVVKNLLHAHERAADQGRIVDLIRLSKFILRLANKSTNEFFDIWLEDSNNGAKQPPNESKEDIP